MGFNLINWVNWKRWLFLRVLVGLGLKLTGKNKTMGEFTYSGISLVSWLEWEGNSEGHRRETGQKRGQSEVTLKTTLTHRQLESYTVVWCLESPKGNEVFTRPVLV